MRAAYWKFAALLTFVPLLSFAQFSPGALSKAHHDLDGPTHCTSCHIGAGGNRKFRCSTCHTEIGKRISEKQGYHARLMAGKSGEDACVQCHSEHNGKDFVPILWDVNVAEFDHRKAGYPLEGGHAGLECKRCHNASKIAPDLRKAIRMRDLNKTFLGLKRECLGCHQDPHGGQVGENCERCHVVAKWKDVSHFDHAQAKYHLTGAHQRVLCAKCHKSEPVAGSDKLRVRYTGMPFAQCQPCHQDPHKGSLAASCDSCHNDLSWKSVGRSATVFDHSKTKFPLLGKHVPLACDKCHKTADFKAPVAHQLCRDCHQDAHGGQLNARADHGECASCHTADGWKPSTYSVAAHATSGYPLQGRHVKVECAGCHKPAGKATLYRVKHTECLSCHVDAHKGQFAAAPHRDKCESCHTVQRWAPAQFTQARHNVMRFRLEGAHAAVSCNECHKVMPDGRAVPVYHFNDVTCSACHFDPHRGQFAERMKAAAGARGAGCEACHNTRIWSDVAAFNHDTSRFPLTGAHAGVTCAQCHRSSSVSTGLQRVIYRDTPRECAQCHEDAHAGQFSAITRNTQDCAQCHETGRWRQARFDHNRADFKLTGAHAEVSCKACHKLKREVAGRTVLFYKPTPKECSGCHAPIPTK